MRFVSHRVSTDSHAAELAPAAGTKHESRVRGVWLSGQLRGPVGSFPLMYTYVSNLCALHRHAEKGEYAQP